jgi:hypothetical protein
MVHMADPGHIHAAHILGRTLALILTGLLRRQGQDEKHPKGKREESCQDFSRGHDIVSYLVNAPKEKKFRSPVPGFCGKVKR